MMEAQQLNGAFAPRSARSAVQPSANRLTTSPLLSDEEKAVLAEALSATKWFEPNIDLIREGDRADSIFVVNGGWACRFATTKDGMRQLPGLVLPGDVANLNSYMCDRLEYGVRTITRVSVVALSRDRALALAAEHPGIARTFTWLGLVENAIASRWLLSIGRRSAKQRLAHLLCELSARLHADGREKSGFPLPLTQEQLADTLGLTSVHVNRVMRDLREEGLVVPGKRTIELPDLARLRQIGGFDPRYLHSDPWIEAQRIDKEARTRR